ncbi:hypothetical protein [Streptomyces sp. WM6378]|uniref:hypothetical protein n=1 Tax=Streptomyces sp. WM6378 TaxID=1415557 RepID=UPI0006ADCA45|nr:hypothetical protein [Streptomyces sp. WM6378]KOU35505.1 hypothetical protein ADK54_37645 [Streptomyces sp. WM6378]
MVLPSWTDTKYGTMKRAALWLVTVVGEGSVFTKEDVKAAFPGVVQADRRVRDLRDHGWQIDTHREDLTLGQHEQRFVKQGVPVWEPGKATKSGSSITQTQRRDVLARDGHLCRSCGIGPGEIYADSYESAQLDIARRVVKQPAGGEAIELVAECNRCRVGGRGQSADLATVLNGVAGLGVIERNLLTGWVSEDKRGFGAVELLWAAFRTLPADSRAKVREALGLPPV